jgi:bifunctional non-homologous end joining protein LigD
MKLSGESNLFFVDPMLAVPVDQLRAGNWIYEVKFDGYRAIAVKFDKEVRLLSRNRANFSDDYPQLVQTVKQLPAKSATLDGEIVALDENGRPSFQLLQGFAKTHKTPLVYYAFDLLFLNGTDLRGRPLVERRKLLAKLLEKAPENIKFSEELHGDRDQLLKVAQQFHLEGLIAKKPDSRYESGRRSSAWLKIKLTRQQELVIGGYTPPQGGRQYFGALLVGYYDKNQLLFAGRVGTGFTDKALETLYVGLQKIVRSTCPFVNLPEKSRGRWGLGITPAVMKRCHWVEPVLVCQIKFTGGPKTASFVNQCSWDCARTRQGRTSFEIDPVAARALLDSASGLTSSAKLGFSVRGDYPRRYPIARNLMDMYALKQPSQSFVYIEWFQAQ